MKRIHFFLSYFIILLFAFFITMPILAQPAGRILFNADFEIPTLTPSSPSPPRQSCNPATACWYLVPENSVPGWNVVDAGTTSTDIVTDNVEFWNSGFNGVPAQSGNQFIELNADRQTPVFFEICMFAGETLTWSLWHRGRSGTDQMSLTITDANNVNLATRNISTGNTDWVNYTGTVTNTGPNGAVRFTFSPISTASGSPTVGNFIDNIQVLGLNPLAEFANTSYSAAENTVNAPRLLVNGTIPVGGATVTITTTGGTATGGGVDYNYNTTVNIPAGNYDGSLATSIPINLTIIDDLLIELGGETINFSIVSASNPLLINDSNCGGSIQSTTVYNIVDNDFLPLPITLVSFSAKTLNKQVQLSWQTSKEIQSAYFEIQHSTNGTDWRAIGQVKAQHNSNTLYQYSFLDIKPQNENYYRLKIIDIDSTYQYSKIVSANFANNQPFDVLIYPNPVGKNEALKIVIPTMAENISVEITDVLGRSYAKYISSSRSDAITINMPETIGIYFVILFYEGKMIQQKIKVQ